MGDGLELQGGFKDERERGRYYAHSAKVAPIYYDTILDDYKPCNDTQRKALTAAKRLIETRHGNLIMLGKNGTGKSMLGSIIAKFIPRGEIWTMFEIASEIKKTYKRDAESNEVDILKRFSKLPVLIIDEVERSYGSEAEKNWISYIVDKRWGAGLPTVMLGNLTTDMFFNKMTPDVISRMTSAGSVFLVIDGDDGRKKAKN